LKISIPNLMPTQLFGPKFKSWWNGEPMPELQLVEANSENQPESSQVQPETAALMAAVALWGEGRLSPADDKFDIDLANALAVQKSAKLIMFSAETGARPIAIIKALNCKVESFESDAKIKEMADKNVKAAALSKSYHSVLFDGKPGSLPKNKADAVLALYSGTSAKNLEQIAFSIVRTLKPSGMAMILDFVLRHAEEDIAACKGDEGREFMLEPEIKSVFAAAGLKIRSDEDWGASLLNTYYARQSAILENWERVQAKLLNSGGIVAAQSLLSQTMVWRARLDALKLGRLTLRKFMLSKE